jgi:glutaminase
MNMDHDPLPGDHPETGHVSTGALPPDTDVQALVSAGYERYRHLGEGAVAGYIPALAAASPSAFGVCVAGVGGRLFSAGVYESEAATNDRNRGIAHLLDGYGRMYCDPDLATDVYTRQCSVRVSARDLAVMGATLANGGANPVTGEQAIETSYCKRVLAVLATAGLYEQSGEWLYDVGLPGKSGVAGGIVTVSPGKGGLGTFSPPLDAAGNSVRGQHITRYLSEALGLNLFASAPFA